MVGSISVEANHISTFKTILSLDFSSSLISVYLASASKNDAVPKFEQVLMSQTLTDGFRDISTCSNFGTASFLLADAR
jgi:hypothetical protein